MSLPFPSLSLPRPPAPSRLIRALDPRVPIVVKRRLLNEGDTELGLTVKNLLDGREEGLAQGRMAAAARAVGTSRSLTPLS